MRDVATVHVLGQLPKYQLARMVLNLLMFQSDALILLMAKPEVGVSSCHLYSRAPHHQVPLEIVVQSQLALPAWLLSAGLSSRKLQPHV